MANLGLIFVLPVVLQDGEHLSAAQTGLWLIPFGLFIIVGAQLGGGLARHWPPHIVIRLGLALEASGLVAVALAVSPGVTLAGLIPGFLLFGIGYGFASSQLVNVVLSDVSREKAGVASAANTTARQVGAALGVAVMGAVLSAETIRARHSCPEQWRTGWRRSRPRQRGRSGPEASASSRRPAVRPATPL